jgi:hypothetical protein
MVKSANDGFLILCPRVVKPAGSRFYCWCTALDSANTSETLGGEQFLGDFGKIFLDEAARVGGDPVVGLDFNE